MSSKKTKMPAMVYGDGVRNDSAGFRAAVAGEPFKCAPGVEVYFRDGQLHLSAGRFVISEWPTVPVIGQGHSVTDLHVLKAKAS